MKKLKLALFGKFKISDEAGNDLSPAGMKSKGVIALLALAPDFCLTRSSIQDKLWSDRFPEQSRSSLRQALSDIRRSLGEYREVLVTTGESVSLNSDMFKVDDSVPMIKNLALDTELFPDIKITDIEFENWIRNQREKFQPLAFVYEKNSAFPKIPTVIFRSVSNGGPYTQIILEEIVKGVSNSLLQFSDFKIYSDLIKLEFESDKSTDQGIVVIIQPLEFEKSTSINATIANPMTGQLNWMKNTSFVTNLQSDSYQSTLGEFCTQIFEGILDTFSQKNSNLNMENTSAVLTNIAHSITFQLDKKSLIKADDLLRQAHKIDPRGHHLSWRSYIRNLSQFEHQDISFLSDNIEISELIDEAIAIDSTNSITLSILAQIDYVAGSSVEYARSLAEKALFSNPFNPLANAVMSNLCVASNHNTEGTFYADRALAQVKGSSSSYFYEFFACMAATSVGEYQKAIMHGELAARLKADFRAPLRYLLVLYIKTKQKNEYELTLKKFQNFEKGFETTNIMEDWLPAYTLRKMKIFNVFDKPQNFTL